jgi:hypothetical protein
MRIIIKPFGAVLLVGVLALLTTLALRPWGSASGNAAPSPVTQSGQQSASTSGELSAATIYNGKLQNGWDNYSWAKVLDIADTKHARPGQAACIRAVPDGYQAIYFRHVPLIPAGYDRLTFYINGGDVGGQVIRLHILFPEVKSAPSSPRTASTATTATTEKIGDNASYGMNLSPLPSHRWRAVTVKLADFGIRGQQKMIGIWLQNMNANKVPEFYVGDVRFLRPSDPAPASD